MEHLAEEFDDKRYPFKYLLKAPLSGAGGFAKRLARAAENLGFSMPMAQKAIEDYDAQGGGTSYQLFAVALTREDQYPRLLEELDRLTVDHFQTIEQHQAEHAGLSHTESLLRDYRAQPDRIALVPALGYEDLGRDGNFPAIRYDLVADWMAQDDPSREIERDTLDDEWELNF